ncbi:MobC domain-containing protein [Janibacter melonis]|uniref:plasmid mobilization relaxosome protein MobC n=1 Tax=Janibacter melonis TaxID=262209 RepID=UPI00174E97C4|nr:plasmid mobilization relaxosome protein MobC [Janibacter melonis]
MAAEQSPRRKAPGRRRANSDEPRDNRIGLSCTDEELSMLFGLAAVHNISIQNLLMRSALAGDSQNAARTAELVSELRDTRQLFSVATNLLNQLAKVANSTGALPAQLDDALRVLERGQGQVQDLLDDFGERWNDKGKRGPT